MLVRRSTGARKSLPLLPRTHVAGLLETTEATSGIAEPFRPVAGKAFASAPFGRAHVVAEPRPQLPRLPRSVSWNVPTPFIRTFRRLH